MAEELIELGREPDAPGTWGTVASLGMLALTGFAVYEGGKLLFDPAQESGNRVGGGVLGAAAGYLGLRAAGIL